MLVDFIQKTDIFDNIDELIELAKQQTYVTRDAHYHNWNRKTFYCGVRSKSLVDIDADLFHKTMDNIIRRVMDDRFVNGNTKVKYSFGYTATAYFHIMRGEDTYSDAWIHQDDASLMAGLVYLNPNPKKNSGTIIYRGDDKNIIDNEYNKLVMYDANLRHAPESGFGDDVNDSRLTLVFFINEFRMRIESES